MRTVKSFLVALLQITTVSSIILLILYRYRIHLPYNIFQQVSFHNGIIYLILCLINIGLIVHIYLSYYAQYNNSESILSDISNLIIPWINKSYDKVMNIIADLPNPVSYLIALVSYYYAKTPIKILQAIEVIPRSLLIMIISVDVFYYERFEYTYYFLYLLLITITSRSILYIAMEVNSRILLEISNSMVIENSSKILNNEPLEPEDYVLTEFNTQLRSVEEGLALKQYTLNEQLYLERIYAAIQGSLTMKLLIRFYYIFIWGYIIYFYPIPIIIILATLIKTNLLTYTSLNMTMLLAGFLYLSRKK